MNDSGTGISESAWKPLYRVGGMMALAMVGIVLIQFAVFILRPPPLEGAAIEWFTLFRSSPMLGLLHFELLMILYAVLSIPLSLALFVALRRVDRPLTAIYLLLSLLGVGAFIAARPAFDMLYLSDHYAAATTESQRSIFLAAGESMLATFHGTAFHVSYILGSLTGLIISAVMLRSNLFSKTTAYARMASSVLDFGLYVPTVGIFLSIFSVLFLAIWDVLIARRFFHMAR